MIAILFFLFLFLAPFKAFAQSDAPPDPSSILDIGFSYTEPSDTTQEFDAFIDGELYTSRHIIGFPKGTHHLKCSKIGYLDYETDFDFPVDSIDNRVDSIDCYLSKTALLTIKVRDNQGNKVTAMVTIDDKEEGESDDSSRFVGRGLHIVTCKKEGYKKYSGEVTITNYVPPIAGVEAPSYYSMQCVLEPLGFWANIWDKLLTLVSNVFKKTMMETHKSGT